MSESVFTPIAPEALSFTEAFGQPVYKVLYPWKEEPLWIDIITDQFEQGQPLDVRQLRQINDELSWLWDNFYLVEAQFGEDSELLREKNQNLFEGEEPYGAESFAAQVILEAIQVNLKGGAVESLQLWYDDGELFGGASILLEWKDRKLSGIQIHD